MVYLIHISIYLSIYLSFCCIYSFSPNTRCFYKLYLLIVFCTVVQVWNFWLYSTQWIKFVNVGCILHSGSSLHLLIVFCTVVQVCICISWLYSAQWFKFVSVSFDCILQRSSIVCNCWCILHSGSSLHLYL